MIVSGLGGRERQSYSDGLHFQLLPPSLSKSRETMACLREHGKTSLVASLGVWSLRAWDSKWGLHIWSGLGGYGIP